jgi:hypothetical protein
VAASHPSYPVRGRKNGLHAVFSPYGVFASQKLQELETADILSAILSFLGLGFCIAKPQEVDTAGIHAGLKQ